jgi:replicative DNA helicase
LRIASFLRELKQLATRHSICIFLLSQLNRESTRGNNPRPQLSNLSESAAVEANADTVLLIYRPEYHGIGQWPEDAHPAVAGQGTQGQCELIAAKSRHQKGYSTVANCDLATNRFWPIQGGYTTYTQVEIAPF